MKINLYDFDNTIYKGDSSTQFIIYTLKKYPQSIKHIPTIVSSAFKHYVLKKINKTQMKENFFTILKYIPNIDKHVNDFWNTHEKNIKEFYLGTNHSRDIIISASPEFLLKPIVEKLKVFDLIASDVDKKTGKFKRENCYNKEKVKRLNEKYQDYKVMESYSDSLSDLPILELAENAYLVKGNNVKDLDLK